ncbi:putative ribonuclease H-like domain-containing protein [Tanacetum coccineum]
MVSTSKDPLTFKDLMATPINFSKYVLNGLKIENLTQDILLGHAFNLLKGTCSSSIELEYNFQECFNALTDKLDWNNPEGDQYLKTSDPEVTYTTSIMKTKAARYEIKGIEDMVPTLWSTIKHAYDKDAILGVKSVSMKKLHGYGHLEEIVVKRSNQQLYKFKEGNFVDLHLNDIEDMLLLAVQHKLFHLDRNVIVDFIVALRMFTRSLILKRRVEDLQLGVKSYQKKLNITKPDVSFRTGHLGRFWVSRVVEHLKRVPAGSVVPTGKDNSIVSTGSTKVIPAGITNLWNIVLKEKKKEKDREEIQKKYYVLHPVLIEETYAVQRETKARTILLQSLPEDHMADFHHLDDARDIWLAVKARFGGNDESKKKRKSMLKQEFLEFRVSESEGLHKGYDRFQKISSQLNQMQAKPDNEDSNMKFLRALPPSWSQVAITLKTKGGLDYLSFDDLYNKLRTLEIDVKGGSSYDSRGTSAPTHSAFISAASTNQDITYEILIQNWENGFGRELDIKWQMAMLSVRINRFEKKAGRKMKFNNKDAARYFHFKLKEWIRQKTKALLSVDSNVKLGHDHEGKEWKNLLGDVSDGCFYDADELPHGSKFGLGFGETFGSDEVFDPSGPSIFDTTPEDVQRNLSMTDQRTIDFDPVFQVFKAPIKLKTNEPLASAPSSVDFKTMTETADQQPSSTKDNPSFSFKENVKPPRNLCNKSGVNSRSLCKRKSFGSKTCFVCGSKFHLIKDCDFYEKQLELHNKPMWTNVANIPSFVPKAASVPAGSRNRPSSVPAGSRNRPSSVPAVKALSRLFLENSKAKYAMGIQEQWWISSIYMENPHKNRDLGIVDSGCSRSMTGNKEKLDDFEKIVGGNVTFGGGDGKITGKGTIRTSKLKFENVYYVEELQNFNLFSVSQICDTKNKVPFTDKECLVLSKESKGIRRDYSNARTPQQNGVAKRKNRTLIEAARTMLADSMLPTMFWTEAVSTACYFEQGKFEGKAEEGFIVGYAAHSKAYRVYNLSSKKIEETLNLRYLEEKPNVQGTQDTNIHAGTKVNAASDMMESSSDYAEELARLQKQAYEANATTEKHLSQADFATSRNRVPASKVDSAAGVTDGSTDPFTPVFQPVHTVAPSLPPGHSLGSSEHSTRYPSPSDLANSMSSYSEMEDIHHHPDSGIFSSSSYDDDFGGTVTNLAPSVVVDSVPTKRVNTIHPQSQILGDLTSPVQTRGTLKKSKFGASAFVSYVHDQQRNNHTDYLHCLFACFLSQLEPSSVAQALNDPAWIEAMQEEMQQFVNQEVWQLVPLPDGKIAIGTKWILKNKRDARGIVVRYKPGLVAQGHRQEEGIDYDEVFAPVARIEAIRLFLAFASYMGFMVYQMDVKSAFLYGEIEEEVYVTQPKGFEDPHFPKHVYRVVKALYGLHQAPRACQDKYVQDMLKKFDMESVRPATTPFEASKPKSKDEPVVVLNLHIQIHDRPTNNGLWYPRDSPFVLEAYSDSDYAGSHGDRKSTTGGCQFLGRRLISWQCKKQTIVATSSTEAEYVAAANCCGQVLKIHTDENVADLLTKAFDGPRFLHLVVHIGMLNP